MTSVSTGIPALDELTGVGGYPCGRITEVVASAVDLRRLQRWIPEVATVDSCLLDDLHGVNPLGVLTPHSALLATAVVPHLAEFARQQDVAVVFLSTLDQEVAKAIKFHAYLRLHIQNGVASVRKNVMAATGGHHLDISDWLV